MAADQSAVFTFKADFWGQVEGRGTVVLSFTGTHTQKVDGKGRMSIPADFRRVLEAGDPEWTPGLSPRMFLLYGDHLKNQLHGYTVDEFTAVVGQINALPRGSVKKKKLSRLIIGQSIKLDVDKDGRTVMPIKQRQKLGLTDGELTFSGLGDHFEIWKAETFNEEVSEDLTAWLEEQGDGYDPLILLDE
ncbi:division/cell wall cluster transcriptional repressor MraZ [Yoonia sp.]|uniref:division/cell wall cluster transcriptional repressor MraZ n=1 Tax=Yoonia sp. TaxID=2212373 RepID=UPI00358E3C61